MKLYKSIANLLLLCTMMTGCIDKYAEFNQDQSGATEEEMDRDGYRVRSYMVTMQGWVIPVSVNTNQFTECLLGGSYGGYLADSNDGFNNRNFSTYIPEEHWIQVAFNDIIPNIMNNYMEIKNVTDDPIFLSVADITKVMSLSRITDIYGPIPYSKIGEDGGTTAPYDSQEEVYNKMFEELDIAIETLTERRTEDFISRADRVFSGNVEKWIRLANSLKLRLAIRISNVNAVLAQQKAEEAANHEIGTMLTNDDNAFLKIVDENPFYVVMYNYNDGDSRISADIASYMNGYNDPRRAQYFVQSTFTETNTLKNGYHGIRTGIMIPSMDEIKHYANMKLETKSSVLWMNAAEAAFLKAEGALKGWNMGTPAVAGATAAEGFYNTGITLSFDQWSASGVSNYLEDETSIPEVYKDPLDLFSYTGSTSQITIKWDETSDTETKLERIITQKWIANFPLGIEAWSEFRRTGYPKLMKVDRNNSGGTVDTERMARRLRYPQEEYTQNSANVTTAVSQYLMGPDNMGTDVWWARK